MAPRNSNDFEPRRLAVSEDGALAARVVEEHALPGVTGASALLAVDGRLLAVHDDAFRASWVDLPGFEVTPLVLAGSGHVLAKAVKPDFECAVRAAGGPVYLFGSGSTERRCAIARIDAHGGVTISQRPDVYRCVRDALRLGVRPNVEGALLEGDGLRLFHRGVGGAPSGVVDLSRAVLDGAEARAVGSAWQLQLGSLDGIALGVTDVAGASGATVFVAAAEDTADAIADGAVTGSVIGLLGRDAGRWTRIVDADSRPYRRKAEGLIVEDGLQSGWILTDADDVATPAMLCRIVLAGFAR